MKETTTGWGGRALKFSAMLWKEKGNHTKTQDARQSGNHKHSNCKTLNSETGITESMHKESWHHWNWKWKQYVFSEWFPQVSLSWGKTRCWETCARSYVVCLNASRDKTIYVRTDEGRRSTCQVKLAARGETPEIRTCFFQNYECLCHVQGRSDNMSLE